MANDKYGTKTTSPRPTARVGAQDTDDIMSLSAGSLADPTVVIRGDGRGPGESQFAKGEVAGDKVLGQESLTEVSTDTEVGSSEATEAGEEYFEASPAQLMAAESGEETAVSDLRNIEGFVEMRESAAEGAPEVAPPLRDAGTAVAGQGEGAQEEFLPILAALAPALISAVGPMVGKAVKSRLSPRAKQALSRAAPKVAAGVKVVAGAVKPSSPKSNLLAMIAKLLEAAEQTPPKAGESGMEVEESFVAEAVAAIEVIIGADDRVRITQTTQEPWRRICALRITFPSGSTYRGTGFLIGPRAVATAGHCVYLHNQGGWARKVEVIPGCNGSSRPFGQVESTLFRSVAGWVTSKKPESDYGCIVLPPGSFGGRNLGSFGFAAFDAPKLLAQPAVVAGHPGDKLFAEMWGMARAIKTVTTATLIYDIDTMGGQSGAPVYVKREGQRYVVGIHNYGAAAGNSATRVTQPVYQRLLAWSQL